ncbi:MAG: hypothetical protein ACRDJG_02980 [Actinomycetota bacterium]
MAYDPPGQADELPPELVRLWNDTIRSHYERLRPDFGSRFFLPDADGLPGATPGPVKWFGDPAEPTFCIGEEVGRELSDWGARGRHVVHNEYCEYVTIRQPDREGRLRPKRVQVTTELREYWVTLAKRDPETVRSIAEDVLGFEPRWEDLYGVNNPEGLSERQREVAFCRRVAGSGGDRSLEAAGVPTQPTGSLNRDNALFMTHPINGLDDLIYIVMFGAQPYAKRSAGELQPAGIEQIFRSFGVEHLACRHADPAAAAGAHRAAYAGRQLAFANPLGVYIHSFTSDVFLFKNEPVPDAWIRWSRGSEDTYQRLEFGPGDEEPVFLDDVRVASGAGDEPLLGGYQIVRNLEVGPLVVAGPRAALREDEFVVLDASQAPIACQEADVCETIRRLKEEHDRSQVPARAAPRTPAPG